MSFKDNLVLARKKCGFTQKALAQRIFLSVEQIKKYEAGKAQPTLDVIRRLSEALGVTSDSLIFDDHNDQPTNERLRAQFQAVCKFTADEQENISMFLDAYIKKHRFEEILSE